MSRVTRGTKIRFVLGFLALAAFSAVFVSCPLAQEPNPDKAEGGGGGIQSVVAYSAEKLRDPFTSSIQSEILTNTVSDMSVAADVPLPEMKIQGIFWGARFPQAIINNKIVKVGEKIEGAQVVSIEKDLIRVFYSNKEFSLSSPASANLGASSNTNDVKKEEIHER